MTNKYDSGMIMPTSDGRLKIIVRQTNWLGDVILSLPFLNALRQNEPSAEITLLSRPRVAAILQHQPGIDHHLICDDEGIHSGLGFFQMASDLRDQKFDVAYLLPNSFSSALMMFLAKIPRRIGFKTDGRGFLLTQPVRKTDSLKKIHESILYLSLLDIHFKGLKAISPELLILDKEHLKAKERLAQLQIKADRLIIGMIPGAAYGTAKRWLPERYVQLSDRLKSELGAEILLFGSASERETAEWIDKNSRNPLHNLAGQTQLRELAALLRECRVVVTNDTGAMHVAAAVGTPVVALFGPTNPVTTSPVGITHTLIRHPVDCSPCLLRHCPIDHRCMTAIEVEEVFEAVRKKCNSRKTERGENVILNEVKNL